MQITSDVAPPRSGNFRVAQFAGGVGQGGIFHQVLLPFPFSFANLQNFARYFAPPLGRTLLEHMRGDSERSSANRVHRASAPARVIAPAPPRGGTAVLLTATGKGGSCRAPRSVKASAGKHFGVVRIARA